MSMCQKLTTSVLFLCCGISAVFGQGSYTAQVRGTITDQSGALVPHAKVVFTDDATGVSTSADTNENGQYVINGLRPAKYTVKTEATGFRAIDQRDVVLAVSQQATLNFTLKPLSVMETVTVTEAAPLLDTSSGSLGTEVTNEFISRMPLADRDVSKLVYLSAGVTELNNGVGYPFGTDFSSNGQRYSSAEFRLDGTLATGPEQGEGATSNLSYVPSAEVIQEFKVQNNSFSAEYGNNGGTVINVLLKSGTNKFHGSGWWYGRRTGLNANDFFSNQAGVPRAASTRDQYGFSVTGPIIKNKTFFLFDLERVRQNDKALVQGRVPTDLERGGDFSQTMAIDPGGNLMPVNIYNPFDVNPDNSRNPFPVTSDGRSNVIPGGLIDPIGQALVNAYPEPTQDLDFSNNVNYTKGVVNTSPSYQFDIKIDHQLNEKNRVMGRYSQNTATSNNPSPFYGSSVNNQTTRNIVAEYTLSINSRLLLTNRFGVDRYYQKETSQTVDPTQFGFSSLLVTANNIKRMPEVVPENYTILNSDQSGSPQCCVDTINGHTQYVYSSALNWVKGAHVFKFGFEQRQFFNNFYQPNDATGIFNAGRIITEQDPFGANADDQTFGNGIATLLLGFPDSGQLNIKTAVANKSLETGFYAQDDWKITPRLTVNLGLRYEWSTPYTERHNRIEFSDFNALSGITVDLTPPTTDVNGDPLPADLSGLGLGPTNLRGITRFPTSSDRHVPVDRNNFGPRLGFAYEISNNTVVRGGAGIFYGFSSTTNFQYAGTAFRRDAPIHFTNDQVTRVATLENLFPNLPPDQPPTAQGTQYGPLANWGYVNQNDLGTTESRNPEIYQWNLGLQHLFPFGVVLSADYSANRSTHLPFGGATRNRNFLSKSIREQLVAQLNPTHDPNNSDVSALLSTSVPNPFLSLFTGPGAIFNEPDSRYSDPVNGVPLINLLRPYPQFDNNFEGLPLLTASSWYNALLVRFQKRPSHGLSFEGSYTWAKATDNSSYGANSFIFFNGSGLGFPQELDNLQAEHSVGANDNRHRFVLGTVYDLPFGRNRWIGGDWPGVVDAIVGGWSVNALLTFQTGQPIPFATSGQRLADGFQRPDIICNPMSGMSLHDVATSTDPSANYFNPNCFADPGDQIAGNAPRFSTNARGPGIKNLDLGIFKDFPIREGMKAEVRAEFLNATNTVRFQTPASFFGASSSFGLVTTQANTPRRIQMAVRFEF